MSRELEVREAVDRFVARIRQQTDAHLESLATELLQIVNGDSRSGRADLERAAVDVARAVAKGGTHARHDLMSRVTEAVRRLDDATTLLGILDALALGAAGEASRVAVLIVEGSGLRSWRHHGFSPGAGPVDLDLEASPTLSSAVRLKQTTPVPPAGDRPDPTVPVFMRVAPHHTGLAMPLVVAQHVVALVYAEGEDRLSSHEGAPVWTEQVEVLVRHAASRLENVTSQRTVEVLTSPS
jgi:hypothetical protein